MNNPIFFKIIVLMLLLSGTLTITRAQDSLKKAAVKKTTVKPVAAQAGGIPINPKTGRPYSKYGYGNYAKTYKATKTADSVKKKSPINVSTTIIATTPPAPKQAPVDTPTKAPPPVDKSLNGQYQYLLTKVYRYQQPYVDALWKNFMDTLKVSRAQLKDINARLADQNKSISGLQADVATKDQTLARVDSISIMGIALSKTSYNLIMWGLVIIIGIIAAIVIAQSGGYRREATYRTALYNELEEDFKTYKAKANDKEKKLARELQTERNKVDELTNKS